MTATLILKKKPVHAFQGKPGILISVPIEEAFYKPIGSKGYQSHKQMGKELTDTLVAFYLAGGRDIFVADTLQRHNLEHLQGFSKTQAYKMSLEYGQRWRQCFEQSRLAAAEILNTHPDQFQFNLIPWSEFVPLNENGYLKHGTDYVYERGALASNEINSKALANAILFDGMNFLRRQKKPGDLNASSFKEYIREELTVFKMMRQQGLTDLVYYSNPLAAFTTLNTGINWVTTEFTKSKAKRAHTLKSNALIPKQVADLAPPNKTQQPRASTLYLLGQIQAQLALLICKTFTMQVDPDVILRDFVSFLDCCNNSLDMRYAHNQEHPGDTQADRYSVFGAQKLKGSNLDSENRLPGCQKTTLMWGLLGKSGVNMHVTHETGMKKNKSSWFDKLSQVQELFPTKSHYYKY